MCGTSAGPSDLDGVRLFLQDKDIAGVRADVGQISLRQLVVVRSGGDHRAPHHEVTGDHNVVVERAADGHIAVGGLAEIAVFIALGVEQVDIAVQLRGLAC